MLEGVLIAESLRVGTRVRTPLEVTRIERVAQHDATPAQPRHWTLLHFRIQPDDADRLAAELADALDETGWYADFRSGSMTYVVYPGRVFSYPRGDADGRAAAVAHGHSAGIPAVQLDWPV